MLRSAGTDIKVQQELLRHANIQTTMNIYTLAVSDQEACREQQGRGGDAVGRENSA
jgi:integrase